MAGLYNLPLRDAARLSGCDQFHPFSRLCALGRVTLGIVAWAKSSLVHQVWSD